jgi:hypothetical protein
MNAEVNLLIMKSAKPPGDSVGRKADGAFRR